MSIETFDSTLAHLHEKHSLYGYRKEGSLASFQLAINDTVVWFEVHADESEVGTVNAFRISARSLDFTVDYEPAQQAYMDRELDRLIAVVDRTHKEAVGSHDYFWLKESGCVYFLKCEPEVHASPVETLEAALLRMLDLLKDFPSGSPR